MASLLGYVSGWGARGSLCDAPASVAARSGGLLALSIVSLFAGALAAAGFEVRGAELRSAWRRVVELCALKAVVAGALLGPRGSTDAVRLGAWYLAAVLLQALASAARRRARGLAAAGGGSAARMRLAGVLLGVAAISLAALIWLAGNDASGGLDGGPASAASLLLLAYDPVAALLAAAHGLVRLARTPTARVPTPDAPADDVVWIAWADFAGEAALLGLALAHHVHVWLVNGAAFTLADLFVFLSARSVLSALRARWSRLAAVRALDAILDGSLPDAAPDDLLEGGRARECSICLEAMAAGKRLPACGHIFHRACLRRWLTEQDACPLCFRAIDEVRGGGGAGGRGAAAAGGDAAPAPPVVAVAAAGAVVWPGDFRGFGAQALVRPAAMDVDVTVRELATMFPALSAVALRRHYITVANFEVNDTIEAALNGDIPPAEAATVLEAAAAEAPVLAPPARAPADAAAVSRSTSDPAASVEGEGSAGDDDENSDFEGEARAVLRIAAAEGRKPDLFALADARRRALLRRCRRDFLRILREEAAAAQAAGGKAAYVSTACAAAGAGGNSDATSDAALAAVEASATVVTDAGTLGDEAQPASVPSTEDARAQRLAAVRRRLAASAGDGTGGRS